MSGVYSVGDRVVTRGGKRGTVKSLLDNGNVLVAFSPTHAGFEMKPTAVVSERAYDGMVGGTRRQQVR